MQQRCLVDLNVKEREYAMVYTNLNSLIALVSPALLDSLKTSFPATKARFSHLKGFEAETERPAALGSPAQANAALAHAQAGDQANRAQLDRLLAHTRKRMKIAHWIKQSGALAALLLSIATAYLAWTDGAQATATFFTALGAAVASLAATLSDMVVKSPSGVSIASPDEFAKLVALRVDAERIKLTLDRIAALAASDTGLAAILDELDRDALDVMRYSLA